MKRTEVGRKKRHLVFSWPSCLETSTSLHNRRRMEVLGVRVHVPTGSRLVLEFKILKGSSPGYLLYLQTQTSAKGGNSSLEYFPHKKGGKSEPCMQFWLKAPGSQSESEGVLGFRGWKTSWTGHQLTPRTHTHPGVESETCRQDTCTFIMLKQRRWPYSLLIRSCRLLLHRHGIKTDW